MLPESFLFQADFLPGRSFGQSHRSRLTLPSVVAGRASPRSQVDDLSALGLRHAGCPSASAQPLTEPLIAASFVSAPKLPCHCLWSACARGSGREFVRSALVEGVPQGRGGRVRSTWPEVATPILVVVTCELEVR